MCHRDEVCGQTSGQNPALRAQSSAQQDVAHPTRKGAKQCWPRSVATSTGLLLGPPQQ